MTTPESRRVQTDRKSSFLDNIGERAELEEKRREGQLRKGTGEGRGGEGRERWEDGEKENISYS